jgi:hypothetical protein
VGRLWLALAFLVALAAPALADQPHVTEKPRIAHAYLELGDQRTSTGLYDVTMLRLDAEVDRYASTIRITLHAANGEESTVETTPDHLVLAYPHLLAPVGTSTLFVTAIGINGIESERAEVTVVAQRNRIGRNCFPLAFLLMVVGAGLCVPLVIGVLFKMRATEAARERVRRETEPTGLANPAAEEYIRWVALRSLLAIVAVTAVVVVLLGVEVWFVPIYGSPLLLVIALPAILRVVNAGRAIALLHRPGAAAHTRFDQVEVSATERHVTLRSSPALVERARRDALPRATL